MQRHIPLRGQCNFRDLGGYATPDGRRIKWGSVFRSGELSQLHDDDLATLERLGIRTVVDLRSDQEREARGEAKVPAGTRVVLNPIASAVLNNKLMPLLLKGDFSEIPKDLLQQVNRDLVRQSRAEYRVLMQEMLDPENLPLVFNCTQGKDRTGFGAALILSALGVTWDDVVKDYLLSNTYRARDNEKLLKRLAGLAKSRLGEEVAVDLSRVSSLLVVDAAHIGAARDQVVSDYGTFAGFVTEGLQIAAKELSELERHLVEDVAR